MPDDLSNSIISRIAIAIKNMYSLLRCRAQRIDSYDPPDSKYGKYWRNAAILCVQHRINPMEFVEVQFYSLKPFPELSQITSEGALERYRKHASEYAAAYMNEFNIQEHAYSRLVEIGKDPKSTLLDENQGFDDLFIYAVAASSGFTDLAQQYEERALAKYLTSVHYDQVYRDVIPESFKKKAIEVWEGTQC